MRVAVVDGMARTEPRHRPTLGVVPRCAVLLALTGLISLTSGCGRDTGKTTGKILVAAGIAPLADFARNVGGDLVEVELLVPPGSSPHTYQITARQMKFVSKASVLVLNGVNLEFWAEKVVDAADNPTLTVIRTADGLETINSAEGRGHLTSNPHVWLDPINAVHQVESIRDALVRADPAHKAEYRANARAYIEKLKRLDHDIRTEVNAFKSKEFIVFHPAWAYFARRYRLVQVAVIETSPGKQPSPSDLRRVIETARKLKAKAIFAEPQLSAKAAEVIAEEAGADVLFLDPLGRPPHYDYIQTMRGNLEQMSRALK